MPMLKALIALVEKYGGVEWWIVICRQEGGYWVRTEVRGVLIRARGSTLERAERRAAERVEETRARGAGGGTQPGAISGAGTGQSDGLMVLLDASLAKSQRDSGGPRLRVVPPPPAPGTENGAK